ncbi:hypothetical protein VP01_441g5 [Puccinia sorghi]|uniref:Protein YIP n=1 Tax=Puccinia sorghi TaxID=27349 RepID=A0A0L6UQF3_9BASI|nr:hypothetical protein VP01_441g5 [Puccinia sorghi]
MSVTYDAVEDCVHVLYMYQQVRLQGARAARGSGNLKMSMYQQQGAYTSSSEPYDSGYGTSHEPLQFYSGTADPNLYYDRQSLEGQRGGVAGTMSSNSPYSGGIGGTIARSGGFWSAFGTGGIDGEPPLLEGIFFHFFLAFFFFIHLLSPSFSFHSIPVDSEPFNHLYFLVCFFLLHPLIKSRNKPKPTFLPVSLFFFLNTKIAEELGINFDHIKRKSFAVLNPFRQIDQHLMDDADLAGPLVFCFCFGMFLLFSGKPQFGYIYGLALLGDLSFYLLLNLMSETGIDAYRVASVLGYCLLPLVLLSLVTVVVSMEWKYLTNGHEFFFHSGYLGYILSILSILWCSYSASGMFVSVLRMSEQRLLVAYPVSLFYATFALLSVFDAKTGTVGARATR